MMFAAGFLLGVVLVKVLEALSPSFKDDLLAQQVVYEAGYDLGWWDSLDGEYKEKGWTK